MVRVGGRYVVVDKPAGMLSVPGRAPQWQDCVAARVRGRFAGAAGPLIVHRLDLETSGLLVVALDADAHRELSRQFRERRVGKVYEAVVGGEVAGDAGVVTLPLRKDLERPPAQVVDREQGRTAETVWRVLAREDGPRTRLELRPRTGRTHQLRLHAAHPRGDGGLGCPILGDTIYGDADAAPRLLLHARELAFDDPDDGARVAVVSPTPF